MSTQNIFGLPGDLPPNLELLQMVSGKWMHQAIYVAAELGVADQLASGPRTSGEVARACGTDDDATYRLLRALANVGVLEEREERVFALRPMGEYLRGDVPGSLRAYARLAGSRPAWQAWGETLHSVRTGEPGFEHAYGRTLFDWYADHLDEAAIFDEAMTAISANEAAAVAESFDFSGIGTVADVGGGRGFLLATLLERNATMRGILFDLPRVVDGASALLHQHGVADRVRIVGGNFLETCPDGADAVVMKHILHDWNDRDAIRILTQCHGHLPGGGRVLVVEAVVPPADRVGWAKMLDLEMLMMTPRGRERTEREYATLFEAAGFRLTRVVPTTSPVSVIEGARI
jgi:hypothetical protein